MIPKSIFSISLDFELHWGIFDNVPIDKRRTYFDNTLNVIPKLLSLFEKHEVQVTWATVGMLFNKDVNDLRNKLPNKLPSYINKKLSAYRFMEEEMLDDDKRFYIAPELIKLIKNTHGQELATHTYAHYYALEKGQTVDEFKADMEKCILLAKNQDVYFNSIVFPRNQFNHNYLGVCRENSIKVVRENPNHWVYSFGNSFLFLKKILRTIDSYFPFFNNTVSVDELVIKDEILIVPSSRLLRPLLNIKLIDSLRIRRIKNEMSHCAKKNKYYHLWFHPHNFGNKPDKAIKELIDILEHYSMLKVKYGMMSLHMENTYNQMNIIK